MAHVDVDGARLAYTEAGRGEPLVFVHGSLEDLRIWRRQVELFSAHYRVIAYSRRYHHPNAVPREGDPAYTASLHAADLADLIEELNLGPAHLVTSSFGGCVALALAGARPELVRSLVLAEPPLMPWLEHISGGTPLAQAFYADAWLPAQRAFREGDSERGVRLFLDGVIGRGPSTSLRTGVFDRLSASGQRMILDNAAEMAAEALSPEISRADMHRCDRARPAGAAAKRRAEPAPVSPDQRRAGTLPAARQLNVDSTDLTRNPRGESRGVSCGGARVCSNASAPYTARYFWSSVLPVGRRRRADLGVELARRMTRIANNKSTTLPFPDPRHGGDPNHTLN